MNQPESRPNSQHADGHARTGVKRGHQPLPATQEEKCLETESGERGEPAEQTGEKKQPRMRTDGVETLGHTGEKTDDETTEHIDREGAPRKFRCAGVMQDPPAEEVTRHGAGEAAEADEEKIDGLVQGDAMLRGTAFGAKLRCSVGL